MDQRSSLKHCAPKYDRKTPQLVFDATSCGSNCSKWLLEIGKRMDVTVNLNNLMKFDDSPDFEVYIENEKCLISNFSDYVASAVKYVFEGVVF